MTPYSAHVSQLILTEAHRLREEYHNLLALTHPNYAGDKWVKQNALRGINQISDILDALQSLESAIHTPHIPSKHPISLSEMLRAKDGEDEDSPLTVRRWRENLGSESYSSIPSVDRKGVFDYYFRYDLYGRFQDGNTNQMNRGVGDPDYFSPPAIVNIALEAASVNNWFGYSHSLGHIETRKAIAELERQRRSQSNITEMNTAVIQGGTAGLDAVLSLIAQTQTAKECVVAVPNYAPIIDDVSHHFTPRYIELDTSYQFDKNKLLSLAAHPNTGVVLLSIPHNPAGFRDFEDILPELHQACRKNGSYLIVDEIIYDGKTSPLLDPIRYPNLIVISSYSKNYNIPGLKLGHLLANEKFVSKFYRHASTTYGSPPSFLYLVATCISQFEKGYRLQSRVPVAEPIMGLVSNPILPYEEFCLWARCANLHKRFQIHAADFVLSEGRPVGIEAIYGLMDPSPNVVLRARGAGTAYQLALEILAATNTAVMPVECFAPPTQWPRDLRVTLSVIPQRLVTGFRGIRDHLENHYAWNESQTWLNRDDRDILERYGLYGHPAYCDGRSKLYKSYQALSDVFSHFSDKPCESIIRVVNLSGIGAIWQNLSADECSAKVQRLSSVQDKSQAISINPKMSEGEIGLRLLNLFKDRIPSDVVLPLSDYFTSIKFPGRKKTGKSLLISLARSLSLEPQSAVLSAETIGDLLKIGTVPVKPEDAAKLTMAIRQSSLSKLVM